MSQPHIWTIHIVDRDDEEGHDHLIQNCPRNHKPPEQVGVVDVVALNDVLPLVEIGWGRIHSDICSSGGCVEECVRMRRFIKAVSK